MTDQSMQRPRNIFLSLRHVTIMAAFVLTSHLSAVRGEGNPAPSRPESSFDFSAADTDGNGCVEGPEELQKFRLHVGKVLGDALHLPSIERALRAGRITHSADINGDGRICECDLLSILVTESTSPGMHRHAFRVYEDGSIFDDVDGNADGYLDDVTEKGGLTQKLAQCVTEEKARSIVDVMSKLEEDDGKVARSEYLLFLKSPPHPARTVPHAAVPPQPQPQPQPQPANQGPQPVSDMADLQQEEQSAGSERQNGPVIAPHSMNLPAQPDQPASQLDPRAFNQAVNQAEQHVQPASQPAVQPVVQPLLATSEEDSIEKVAGQPVKSAQPVYAAFRPKPAAVAQPVESQPARSGTQPQSRPNTAAESNEGAKTSA